MYTQIGRPTSWTIMNLQRPLGSGTTRLVVIYSNSAKLMYTEEQPFKRFPEPYTEYGLGVNIWVSVQFSHSAMSDSLRPHGLQHARPPCWSSTPGACSNSCPSSWWCHPTISSSVIPFSSCFQSFPASGSSPMSSSHQMTKTTLILASTYRARN